MAGVSKLSISETVLAALICLFFGYHYNYYTTIIVSAFAAPFVFLRSDKSTAFGVKLFKATIDHLKRDDYALSDERYYFVSVTFLEVVPAFFSLSLSYGLYYFVSDYFWWQYLFGVISVCVSVFASTLVLSLTFAPPTHREMAHCALYSLVGISSGWTFMSLYKSTQLALLSISPFTSLMVVSVPLVIVLLSFPDAPYTEDDVPPVRGGAFFGGVRLLLALGIAVLCISAGPVALGAGSVGLVIFSMRLIDGDILEIGSEKSADIVTNMAYEWGIFFSPVAILITCTVFIVSLSIRIFATTIYVFHGIYSLADNFRRLVLYTSLMNAPELIPGLPRDQDAFTLRGIWRNLKPTLAVNRYFMPAIYLFYAPIVVFWYVPAWIYRFSLKSTCWFWWPLAYIFPTHEFSSNEERIIWRYYRSKRANISLIVSILVVLSVLTVSGAYGYGRVVVEYGQSVPLLAFSEVVLFAVIPDNPIKILAVTISGLGCAVPLAIDYLEEGRRFGVSYHGLRSAAYFLISTVSRLRFILSIILWVVIFMHAVFLQTDRYCYMRDAAMNFRLGQYLFAEQLPLSKCL